MKTKFITASLIGLAFTLQIASAEDTPKRTTDSAKNGATSKECQQVNKEADKAVKDVQKDCLPVPPANKEAECIAKAAKADEAIKKAETTCNKDAPKPPSEKGDVKPKNKDNK